ncbi:MAG: hypothetical protein KJO24_00535, partial [Gammaproteobacteria bacterium]|nr:hypothetical protein [Gammaproteobacteria bacterium]
MASALAQLAACGGSGGGGAVAAPPLPEFTAAPLTAASASLSFAQVKRFRFSRSDAPDASYYRLLENVDGQSGFSVIADNIAPGTQSIDIEVPLCHRLNASYFLQSCNPLGCTDSATVPV